MALFVLFIIHFSPIAIYLYSNDIVSNRSKEKWRTVLLPSFKRPINGGSLLLMSCQVQIRKERLLMKLAKISRRFSLIGTKPLISQFEVASREDAYYYKMML